MTNKETQTENRKQTCEREKWKMAITFAMKDGDASVCYYMQFRRLRRGIFGEEEEDHGETLTRLSRNSNALDLKTLTSRWI